MVLNIAIGCVLVVLTTFIHAAGMLVAVRILRISRAEQWAARSAFTRASAVAALVLIMFLAAIVESWVWAAAYLAVDAISDLEQAIYFSTVTYTTLGYGDVVLDERWRLLSSLQAAGGIIMFGWTTAIIVAAVHRLYITIPQDNEQRA
jgi:hypothetical protein